MNAKTLIVVLLIASSLFNCGNKSPVAYSLISLEYVPDSLKAKHREFITETIRAASQHMTGGDYEDVDQTIIQAKRTADQVFAVSVMGLEKRVNNNSWDNIKLRPEQFTPHEKHLFDSLLNLR